MKFISRWGIICLFILCLSIAWGQTEGEAGIDPGAEPEKDDDLGWVKIFDNTQADQISL